MEEEYIGQADGGRRYYRVQKVPMLQDGRIVGLCSVATDITDRRRIEEALNDRVEEMNRTRKAMLNIMDDLEDKTRQLAEDITARTRAEKEIREHVEELERFNRLTVSREQQMIALKVEINALLEKAGQGKKYKIVE